MKSGCSDLVNILLLIGVLCAGCGHEALLSPRTMYSMADALAEPANANSLVLTGQKLAAVPPEIARLKSLRGLDLSNNQLTRLGPELVDLPSLELLDLRGNALTGLPPEFARLKLKRLYLNDNKLTSLANLPPSLEELYVSHNQLQSVEGLEALKNLRLLHLAQNRLSQLPPELGGLANLEELNVSENRLSAFPPTFGDLDRMSTLIARNNQIDSLGFDPARNDRLLLVWLEGNPIPLSTQEELRKAQSRSEWRFSPPSQEEEP